MGGSEAPVLPDDDTLVLTVDEHVPVHVVGEGIDVWRILILGLPGRADLSPGLGARVLGTMPPTQPHAHRSLVELDLTVREVGHLLEGVYRDEHRSNVGLGWGWLRAMHCPGMLCPSCALSPQPDVPCPGASWNPTAKRKRWGYSDVPWVS